MESIQFLDEAQILSVVSLVNRIRVRLDRDVTSTALVFVDTPQHPLVVTLLIFQAPKQYNVTLLGQAPSSSSVGNDTWLRLESASVLEVN